MLTANIWSVCNLLLHKLFEDTACNLILQPKLSKPVASTAWQTLCTLKVMVHTQFSKKSVQWKLTVYTLSWLIWNCLRDILVVFLITLFRIFAITSRKPVRWYWLLGIVSIYSISQEICTRFCCALLCCGYAIVHNEFTWSIYPYSSALLCWHWGNR